MCINFLCPDYSNLRTRVKDNEVLIEQLKATNSNLLVSNTELQKELNILKLPNQNEVYWNTKYPNSLVRYSCRWNNILDMLDVRWFFGNSIDDFEQIVKKDGTDDERMLFIQKWVRDNIVYDSDTNTYKVGEYWADSMETLRRRRGDCEDGAILMANLAMTANIPYWRIRITAGDVEGGGHAYVTYLSDSQLTKPFTEQSWKVCDWCYYPDVLPFDERPNYKDEPKYYTDKIWFSFNKKYAFSTQGTTATKKYIVKPLSL